MSLKGQVEAECPAGCGPFEAEVWTLVHAAKDPELKELLMGGELNIIACPNCSRVFYYEHTVIYLDPPRELLAFVYPEPWEAERGKWELKMREDTAAFRQALPKASVLVPQLFFGLEALIEALHADDEAAEEDEVTRAEIQELGLEAYEVSPAWARPRDFPAVLPLAGKGDLQKRALAGLQKLVKANDRLERSVRLLKAAEQKWEEPPRRDFK